MALTLEISMSLDGFVAGRNPTLEERLGEGGERLHDWVVRLPSWRRQPGLEGGESHADDELVAEASRSIGAHIMGRRMFSGGSGPWEQDPNADGWWGDEPPFHHPVFMLTHHAREPGQAGWHNVHVRDGGDRGRPRASAGRGRRPRRRHRRRRGRRAAVSAYRPARQDAPPRRTGPAGWRHASLRRLRRRADRAPPGQRDPGTRGCAPDLRAPVLTAVR